jgi:hypothetical protein
VTRTTISIRIGLSFCLFMLRPQYKFLETAVFFKTNFAINWFTFYMLGMTPLKKE